MPPAALGIGRPFGDGDRRRHVDGAAGRRLCRLLRCPVLGLGRTLWLRRARWLGFSESPRLLLMPSSARFRLHPLRRLRQGLRLALRSPSRLRGVCGLSFVAGIGPAALGRDRLAEAVATISAPPPPAATSA